MEVDTGHVKNGITQSNLSPSKDKLSFSDSGKPNQTKKLVIKNFKCKCKTVSSYLCKFFFFFFFFASASLGWSLLVFMSFFIHLFQVFLAFVPGFPRSSPRAVTFRFSIFHGQASTSRH